MPLTSSEHANIDGLFNQLKKYDAVNLEKQHLYEGKNKVKPLGIAIDPKLVRVQTTLGWVSTVVNVFEERLDFQGFLDKSGTTDIQAVVRANDLDLESTLAHRDALIYGVGFVAVGSGNPELGEPTPLITVESPKKFTADYDLRTRRIKSALSVNRNSKGQPITGALYLENETVYLEYMNGKWVEVFRDNHNLGRVPIARIVNNPRTGELNGSSEITPAVKDIVDASTRTLQHMAITSEFFSAPKYAMLGAARDALEDSDGNPINALKAITGTIWDIPLNDDTGTPLMPQLQQLNANSPAPFIEQIKLYAQLLSQATGVPSNYLGFQTDNPTSADALKAMEIRLIKAAERKQVSFSRGWMEVARLALLVRDGSVPDDFNENVSVQWKDPTQITQSAAADATFKLIQAGVLLPDSEVTYSRLGMSDTDKEILTQEKQTFDAKTLLNNLATAADSAAGEEVVAGEETSQTGRPETVDTFNDIENGSVVRFNSNLVGQVEHIMIGGILGIEGSEFAITGTSNNPALQVRLWEIVNGAWQATPTVYNVRYNSVTVLDGLPEVE
jgi:hypothetical protein